MWGITMWASTSIQLSSKAAVQHRAASQHEAEGRQRCSLALLHPRLQCVGDALRVVLLKVLQQHKRHPGRVGGRGKLG